MVNSSEEHDLDEADPFEDPHDPSSSGLIEAETSKTKTGEIFVRLTWKYGTSQHWHVPAIEFEKLMDAARNGKMFHELTCLSGHHTMNKRTKEVVHIRLEDVISISGTHPQ